MQFLPSLIAGLAHGALIGLLALGLVLVYQTSRSVHLALGDFMMLGAVGGLLGMDAWELPYWLVVPLTLVVLVVVGFLLERWVLRLLPGSPLVNTAVLSLGFGYLARCLVQRIAGLGSESLAVPYLHLEFSLDVASPALAPLQLSAVPLVTLGASGLLWGMLGLLHKSRWGMALQATAQNPVAARHMGIPVNQLRGLAWALSAGLAGAAGLLAAPSTQIDASMGLLGLQAFPAALLGGLGSWRGAMAGGLLFGVLDVLSAQYVPPHWQNVAVYGLALCILIAKPQGLCGRAPLPKASSG